jgi:aminoglycoside phosphotransferase (APT) family kinase protein
MQAYRSQLPDLPALTAGLRSVFGDGTGGNLVVIERQPNDYASTFPSEVLTLGLADGRRLRLLCKYEAGRSHSAYGHRGGVVYEAAVYRHVLQPLPVSAPKFYGSHAAEGGTWLLIEYVEDGIRASESSAPAAALRLAARWIGGFHAANEARLTIAETPFLNTYDGGYYLQWAHRTLQFAGHRRRRLPWLATLGERFADVVEALSTPPLTVIHGEYGPKNILVRGPAREDVCPVDWESAAIAMGEIDLTSLIQNWPPEVARECECEYRRARWPAGPPADFERRLDLARL